MKNKILPIVIFSIALMYGCGTGRHAQRTHIPDVSTDARIPTVILYPKGYEPGLEPGGYEDTGVSDESYAEMTFSGLECDHVRVRGVNPLPQSGTLEVNLDRLKHQFVYPYRGKFLSDYGMRNGRAHTGVDIKAVPNDTIRAILPGVVRMSKEYSSYGNVVVVQHYCGFETVYSHCSRNLVKANDKVKAGDPIGLAGRTGRATTEHLHFEVRVAGNPIDPKLLLDLENQTIQTGMLYATMQGSELVAYASKERLADGHTPQIPKAVPEVEVTEIVRLEPVEENTSAAPKQTAAAAAYHTVVKGDTLYGIARKYSTTVAKLCSLNGITEKSILSLGQKIRYR